MSRYDYDWMTPIEFQNCIDVYNENKKYEHREKYELSRFNAWLVSGPNLKSGTEQIDFCQFDWEEKEIKKGKVIEYAKDSISKVKPSARRG